MRKAAMDTAFLRGITLRFMSDPLFPPVFAARMEQLLGNAWPAFQQSHAQPSPVSLRINPAKPSSFRGDSAIPWAQHGYYLNERPVFTLDPALHAGAYYVQEASSMFLEQAIRQHADTERPLTVLDLCAAPGGKSTHLASLLSPTSLLVSNEVIRPRASILAENLQKWGVNNVVVTNNDPEDFQRVRGFFDVIVVDAPCSGEGLFRKDPDAMSEWSEDAVALCSARQRRILSDIWPSLREGGILIYATCTYNRLENEENLQWLQQEYSAEFLPLAIAPAWNIVTTEEGDMKGYRFFPHRLGGEGFFLAVVQKTSSEAMPNLKAAKDQFTSLSKKLTEQVAPWLRDASEKTFILRDDLIQCFPANKKQEIAFLARNLRLVTAGTFVATVKHEKLVPEHAMALSVALARNNFQTLTLDKENALRYLRKETLEASANHKGYCLVEYEGLALGWVNALTNRLNNLYPQEWRVRMGG